MKFLQIPINKLIEWKWNKETREIKKDKFLQLIESLKESGSLSPIHVSISCPDQKEVPDYSILGGNHCLKAIHKIIKETGIHDYDSLWCVVHCPQDKDEALTISKKLNSHYANDSDNLFNIMDAFKVNWSNINLGFDSPRTLEEQFPTTPNIIEDEPPPIDEKNIICKTGDLWELGRHRLLCGDSTKREDVERLMDGKKADMTISSPPYWNQRSYSQWNNFQNYLKDMKKAFSVIFHNSKNGAILFWNVGDDSPNHRHISAHHSIIIEDEGFIYIDSIIWKKQGMTGIRLSHQKKHNKYYPGFSFEPLLVFQKPGGEFPVFELGVDIPLTNVWEISTANNKEKEHLAPYPVKLPVTAMNCYSIKDNGIYDPFLGGGTTLIACEQLNRICYGMEIKPFYCDVIIKRYIKFTGNNKLKRNGKEYVWKI